MSEEPEVTRQELLKLIRESWPALQAALGRLTEDQLETMKDEAGWSIKDHVLHLAAWERSAAYMLQGKPRHTALGIDEELYLSRDFDRINTAVREQHTGIPAREALAQLREVHAYLMDLLAAFSDEALYRPYGAYLPDEPRPDNSFPAINVVYGDTAAHFAEHLATIEALLAE